jgi:hypothetical protein
MHYTGTRFTAAEAEQIRREARLAVKPKPPREESIRRRDWAEKMASSPEKQREFVARSAESDPPPDRDATIRHGLRLADPNGLEKWRAEAVVLEQAQQHEREMRAVDELRAEMCAELASIREEMIARRDLTHEAVGEFVGQLNAEAENSVAKLVKQVQRDLWAQIERRFAALSARLDVLAKGSSKARAKNAQNSPVDIPNPLSRRELN